MAAKIVYGPRISDLILESLPHHRDVAITSDEIVMRVQQLDDRPARKIKSVLLQMVRGGYVRWEYDRAIHKNVYWV
jgi:hypothetical protein